MRTRSLTLLLATTFPGTVALVPTSISPPSVLARPHLPPPAAARVTPNDNRARAGTLRGGVLTLRLVARLADWHPDGDSASGATVPAFAEEGRAPSIPGPLVRVPAGTEVAVTVRNALPTDTLELHGLGARSHPRGDSRDSRGDGDASGVSLAPGTSRTLRFRLDVPGTYYYWGTTMHRSMAFRTREDAQLSGAIVVDPAGARTAAHDRVLVIGMWSDTVGRVLTRRDRVLVVVNGLSWPHTERLAYMVGDTVRLRLVNASADSHPMHLHGFYFHVDAKGNGVTDTVYADTARRRANTEDMMPGATMMLTWVPERAGNWLFHCHLPEHFGPRGPLGLARDSTAGEYAAHGAHVNHALEEMNGLVMGVTVRARPGDHDAAVGAGAADDAARRHLRLLVRRNAGSTAAAALYGFALQDGAAAPPPDSGLHVGPPIVLTRGQPVSIMVVNTLAEPTAVHWHGIELESYYDGVAGFSGSAARVTPAIAPGDSFEARFTPPRAGTFIYHTHLDERNQQLAGLAGPLVVLEPGARYDPTTDISVLVTSPRDSALERRAVLLNGSATPAPLTLRVGTSYRLRFVNMTTRRPGLHLELRRDTTLLRWRALAKDGADLPERWRVVGPARQSVSVGETADVEVTPDAPGELLLEARAAFGPRLGVLRLRVLPAVSDGGGAAGSR